MSVRLGSIRFDQIQFVRLRYSSISGPPAVCVNARIGFFCCVNAWKLKKKLRECLNWKNLRERENPLIDCVNAWMRESALFFCVDTWIFPFPQFSNIFPNFQIFSPIFKYFPDFSEKVRMNFQKNLRECVNCEKNLLKAWNWGPLRGPH